MPFEEILTISYIFSMRENYTASRKQRIGKRLKALRGKLSQGEMANRLEITQSYLCEIEKGKRSPSFDLLQSFAKKLNTSVAFLIGESDETGAPAGGDSAPLFLDDEDQEDSQLYTELMGLVRQSRTTLSVDILLALAKDKLKNQETPLNEHDKATIYSLLKSCMALLAEK